MWRTPGCPLAASAVIGPAVPANQQASGPYHGFYSSAGPRRKVRAAKYLSIWARVSHRHSTTKGRDICEKRKSPDIDHVSQTQESSALSLICGSCRRVMAAGNRKGLVGITPVLSHLTGQPPCGPFRATVKQAGTRSPVIFRRAPAAPGTRQISRPPSLWRSRLGEEPCNLRCDGYGWARTNERAEMDASGPLLGSASFSGRKSRNHLFDQGYSSE